MTTGGTSPPGTCFYIAYPEPDTGPNLPSMTAWEQAASALMAGAQADPNIDFIVTFGHRTAFTDSGTGAVPATHDALVALAAIYSPAPGNTYGMYGKYVVNIQHDAHNMEAFAPNPNDNKHGLTYITDAAGGQGMTNWVTKIDPDSVFRMRHLGILVSRYDAAARTLSFSFVCGSHSSASEDPCNYGSTLWSTSFTAAPPAVATVATTITGADQMLPVGGQTTFTATVRNPAPGTSVAGASLSVSVPDGMSIVSADPGADITGNVRPGRRPISSAGATSTVEHVVAQVDSGDPGSTRAVSATVATADTSCDRTGEQLLGYREHHHRAATATSADPVGQESERGKRSHGLDRSVQQDVQDEPSCGRSGRLVRSAIGEQQRGRCGQRHRRQAALDRRHTRQGDGRGKGLHRECLGEGRHGRPEDRPVPARDECRRQD